MPLKSCLSKFHTPPPLPAFFVSGKDLPVLRVGIRGQIRNVHSSAHELENLTARPASHSSYSQVVCCEVFPCIDVDLQISYHYLKPTQIPFRLELPRPRVFLDTELW